jgi:hypothetical protein
MKTTLLILALMLAPLTAAKDKQYDTGTLKRVTVENGWTDTTHCYDTVAGDVHCSGGIHDDYAFVYLLMLANGQIVALKHAPLRADVVKHLDLDNGPVAVQYRIEHKHWQQTFILIADPSSGKEGWYYTEDKLK